MSQAKTERNNEIIRLRDKENMTFRAIALLKKISEAAVRKIYNREKKRLLEK